MGDSSKVQVGDYALAVGDPFGVGQTVTMGIVSATGRSHLGIEDYEDFIQTDAPINPGNSGGALVNDRGELIGINTAIIAHGSEGNQGIGFAIPANMARNVMEQIVDHGKVTRAYLGILPQDVTPDLAKQFGEKEARGALVADVSAGSPAQKSGLERGDIILDVNGKPVTDSNDLRMTISMMAPDSDANLKVLRSGSDKDISVKLSAMPAELGAKNNSGDNSEDNGNGSASSALSGVSVQNLDAQAANELGLSPNTKGVVVTKVDPSSDAAEAGLRRGRCDSGSEPPAGEEHGGVRARHARLERQASSAGEPQRQHDVPHCLKEPTLKSRSGAPPRRAVFFGTCFPLEVIQCCAP